jgi:hypothetical protein
MLLYLGLNAASAVLSGGGRAANLRGYRLDASGYGTDAERMDEIR